MRKKHHYERWPTPLGERQPLSAWKQRVGGWIGKISQVSPRLGRLLLYCASPFPLRYIDLARRAKLAGAVERRVWCIGDGPLAGFKLVGLSPSEIVPVLANKMEIRCSKLLQRLPSIEGGVVLDVGGSYGYYALLLSRSVGSRGRVYTFEPDWRSFQRLTRNLVVNNVENVVAVPLCASSAPVALAPWLSCEDEPWNSRLMSDGIGNNCGRQRVVPVVRLDDFAEALRILGRIRLIKIDVEGAELQVLQGARRILDESGPLVLCELHGTEVAEQVFALLSERGYQQEMIEYMSETRQHILACPGREAQRTRAMILTALG